MKPTSLVEEKELRDSIKNIIWLVLHHILGHADECSVTYMIGSDTTVFEVDVHKDDFGRLLGAKGKNINALRVIVSSMAATHRIRAIVNIKDESKFF